MGPMLEYGQLIGRIGTRSYAKLSPLPNSKSGGQGASTSTQLFL